MKHKEIFTWIFSFLTIISTLVTIVAFPRTAIIIGGGIIIVLLVIFLTRFLVLKYYKKFKIFYNRDKATPSMIEDLKKYKHLAFIGVSHTKLHDYLENAIKFNEDKELPLPWESILVFFATHELGDAWESKNFENNIKQSKINITNMLFKEGHKKLIPKLNMVQFRQCKSMYKYSNFNGCFLGDEIYDNSNINLQVLYSVNHLPISSQTEKSWTIRLEKNPLKTDLLFKEFENSFTQINTDAEKICDINFSLWEWSVEEWNNFVENYEYFETGVDNMLNGLDMNNKQILDIGSGTGNVANYLAKKFPQAKLTLVDASANMLRKAKETIGDNAIYELFHFPLVNSYYFIKNNKEKYDYIISHLSLQSIINNSEDFYTFASNCNNLLRNNGCVILAIHNSFDIQVEQNRQQNDKFRIDLKNEIDKKKGTCKETINLSSLFSAKNICEIFKEKHFEQIYFNEFSLPFTMLDRKRLWEVPAILDSLVNIETIGINRGKEIVRRASEKNETFETPDRKMMVFHFQKKSKKALSLYKQ